MKYKYYIVSLLNGDITGTDSDETATEIAESDDDFVIMSDEGKWIDSAGKQQEIKEYGKE